MLRKHDFCKSSNQIIYDSVVSDRNMTSCWTVCAIPQTRKTHIK